MKRIASFGLTLLLLLSLCVPFASAAPKGRKYPGFSDLSADSPYLEAVKSCYEAGLIEGMADGSFQPQGNLTVGQLVVLAGRLYSLQNGGKGELPAPPEWKGVCLRFYGPDGKELKTFSIGDSTNYNSLGGSLYIQLSETPDDPALPETCTMEAGLEGYGEPLRFEGSRQSYGPSPSGFMTQGFSGTGYHFQSRQAANLVSLYLASQPEEINQLHDVWWFPAAFLLLSQGQMSLASFQRRAAQAAEYSALDPIANYSAPASRALFAWLVDLSAGALVPVHETVTVPDLDQVETEDQDAVLRLYKAGILTGVDSTGRFSGDDLLTRGQAALMLARVLNARVQGR